VSEPTPVTAHLQDCAAELLHAMLPLPKSTPTHPQPMRDGYEAVLALSVLPWDDHTEQDGLFREGYETALLDVVDAVAQAWGVELPKWVRP
jgi:hypothetical protein